MCFLATPAFNCVLPRHSATYYVFYRRNVEMATFASKGGGGAPSSGCHCACHGAVSCNGGAAAASTGLKAALTGAGAGMGASQQQQASSRVSCVTASMHSSSNVQVKGSSACCGVPVAPVIAGAGMGAGVGPARVGGGKGGHGSQRVGEHARVIDKPNPYYGRVRSITEQPTAYGGIYDPAALQRSLAPPNPVATRKTGAIRTGGGYIAPPAPPAPIPAPRPARKVKTRKTRRKKRRGKAPGEAKGVEPPPPPVAPAYGIEDALR